MVYQKLLLLLCSLALIINCSSGTFPDEAEASPKPEKNYLDSILTPISTIESLFTSHLSDVTVTVCGRITKMLSDDTTGDRHQRFIIELSNRQTLLMVHNIDIAPRVANISVGCIIYAHGDYVWNNEGGLVHWTHHDPAGTHENGWIEFETARYQ